MTDAQTEKHSVVIERELDFPPEKIWRALTQPHLVEEWLMETDLKPVVGHQFQMRRQPRPDVDVVVDCEVLEVEPQHRLVYTWQAFDFEGVVTWTITETPGGARLRMEQSGFPPDQKRAIAGAHAGLGHAFARLEALLARMD